MKELSGEELETLDRQAYDIASELESVDSIDFGEVKLACLNYLIKEAKGEVKLACLNYLI